MPIERCGDCGQPLHASSGVRACSNPLCAGYRPPPRTSTRTIVKRSARPVCPECSVRTLDENGDCPYCDR
jgi:hypothetical protein